MSKSQYYDERLKGLNQIFSEFAAENPPSSEARAVTETDPDVQDLLKGFAYLTADLKSRVELSHNDLYQLYAQYLLGVLYWSKPSALMARVKTSGEFFSARGGVSRFSTGAAVSLEARTPAGDLVALALPYAYALQPFEVASAVGEQSLSAEPYLELECQIYPGMSAPAGLRFHLGGEYKDAVNLYALLLHNTLEVKITAENGRFVTLPKDAVLPYGLEGSQPLFSQSPLDLDEIGLLLEYALLPEKLLAVFVDLREIHFPQGFWSGSKFHALFKFSRQDQAPFPTYRPEALEGICSNAVGLVNLFAKQSVPVQYKGDRTALPLLPASSFGEAYPQSVLSVFGVVGDGRREFYDYNAYVMNSDLRALVYTVKAAAGSYETPLLSIEPVIGPSEEVYDEESFVCTLLCTNGPLARDALASGSGWRLSDAPLSRYSRVSEFVPMLSASLAQEAVTRELAISGFTLQKLEELTSLLEYIHLLVGRPVEAFKAQISHIVGVEVSEDLALRGTQVISGQLVKVYVSREGFASVGEIALLGQLLSRLYESYAPINCFTRLEIREQSAREQVMFSYPILIGGSLLVEGQARSFPSF